MKNLIEVLFEFKDKGAEVIDENREKLLEMAKAMDETSKQALSLANTQKQIDDALSNSTDVIKRKTKEEIEAAKEQRKIAKERLNAEKEEAKQQQQLAEQEKNLAKEQLKIAREKANEEKKIAKQQREFAKQKANEEKKLIAQEKALLKEKSAQEKVYLQQEKQRIKEEQALLKEKSQIEKQTIKEKIDKQKELSNIEKENNKKKIAEEKQISRQQKQIADELEQQKKLQYLNEKMQIIETIKLRREKEKAEKEAMLSANRAARESERQAKAEVRAKEMSAKASEKASKLAEKEAKALSRTGKNTGTGDPKKDISLMDQANEKMAASVKNLKYIRLGLAGIVAAAIVGISAFARQSADEFYKMQLSAEFTGIDVSVLQEYKNVLDSVGISTDEFSQKLRALNERFVEAFSEDSGEGLEVLKTLNLDIEKFAKAKPEEKFELIAEATKDLSKVQQLQLFDKLGLDNLNLVINRMDKVKERRDEIARTGLVVSTEEAKRLKDFETSYNKFTNNLKTFSTIIYSALIPALKDTFADLGVDFEMTRNGANGVAIALIDIVKFFGQIGLVGKYIFDEVINKFQKMGVYTAQIATHIEHFYNTFSISLGGIVDILKNIDIGSAISDLASKTFSGIIDVVFGAMDTIISGIEKVASAISGVVPDAVLSQINNTKKAISQYRSELYGYEKSEESKRNDEIIKDIKKQNSEELKLEDDKYNQKLKIGKENLSAIKEEQKKDFLELIQGIDKMKPSESYIKTATELEKENIKDQEEEIKSLQTADEKRLKEIEKLLEGADIIKAKIDLGIKNAETGANYLPADFLEIYDQAIKKASESENLLAKQLELRIKRRDDEINFYNDQYSKKSDDIRKSLENLKTLDEISGENVFNNQEKILQKYNEIIQVARTYKKDEADINKLIQERDNYIKEAQNAQESYNRTIADLETSLLQEQNKNAEVRARNRQKELAQIEKDFQNANPALKQKALSLTDSLINIQDAKARLAELETEIDKLIDRRNNKTDILDRSEMLRLEEEINNKIKERGSLEADLGIKREEANKGFILSISTIKDILENTYNNLSTLVSSTVSGVSTLQDATKKFFQDTLLYIAQLFQKALLFKALQLFGSATGWNLTSFIGGSGSTPVYHDGGMAKSGVSGNGIFDAFGKTSSTEMSAILNNKEAVLTEVQQQNLGNYIADGSSSGNVTAVIHNNINASSLSDSITSTSEFKNALKNEITRNSQTYKAILNS